MGELFKEKRSGSMLPASTARLEAGRICTGVVELSGGTAKSTPPAWAEGRTLKV